MIDGTTDSHAITHNYRGVRSDEWVVSTQMAVAQAQNHFRRVNQNIAGGQDMSLMGDVPYKDWSSVFKPQNLAFFGMPLEYAYAFRWWLSGFVLIVASYFLALEFFPRKRLLATLIASIVGLSPLLFWWYSSSTFLSVAYPFIGLMLAMRILKSANTKLRLIYSLLLAYVLTCFALILYPPFQIACALPIAIFFIGYLIETYSRESRGDMLKALGFLAAAAVIAGMAVLLFLDTRSSAVNLVTHTTYPGKRIEISGGIDPILPFSSFLSPNLQYETQASVGYLRNQSEAANFILIAPFLLFPSLYMIIREFKKHRKILWGLLFTDGVMILFLSRMLFRTPWLDPFYHYLGQDKVPPTRLLIGLGVSGIIQLILICRASIQAQLSKLELRTLALIGATTALGVMFFVGVYTLNHYPFFLSNPLKVIVFALWIATAIYFILRRPVNLGLAMLVLFSFFSVYRIMPLYRGLGPLTTSAPIRAIESVPNDGSWVVVDDRLLINFPIMAGRRSLNSVQFYPQLAMWHQLDPSGHYAEDYNRYAHVVFDDDPTLNEPFALPQADVLDVKFDPCGTFLQHNAKYVLAAKKLTNGCLEFKQSVDMPAKHLYIYQITPASS